MLPLIVAVAFFLLEKKQHELSVIYQRRAEEIEVAMVRLRSGSIKDLSSVRFVPGIATTMSLIRRRKRKLVPWRRAMRDLEYLIYWAQAIVIGVVAYVLFVRSPPPVHPDIQNIIYCAIGPLEPDTSKSAVDSIAHSDPLHGQQHRSPKKVGRRALR